MRDALLLAAVFGILPFAFKRPAIGALLFAWISLMNPHRLTYGFAYSFQFAAIVSGVTILAVMVGRQRKNIPLNAVTITFLLFTAWTTLTCIFALEPQFAWGEWERVMKTFLMILITMMAVREAEEIKQLTWVTALSLGFYGLKGGIFTLSSGGNSRVFGPDDSYIADNNALALALITVVPLLWCMLQQVSHRYLRYGIMAVMAMSVVAAAGSYSRGGMVAGAAMLGFLWLKSKSKLQTGIMLALIAPVIYLVMPEQWFHRMDSIDNYAEDASALGRINAWWFAFNVATSNLLGGGFNVFSPRMFTIYAPNPHDHHAAHSIFFQVLGEHGFIGLTLYVLLLIFTWRTGTRILQATRDMPSMEWVQSTARMCQVSLVGFIVGGAFLSLAYYDLLYYIVTILVALERLVGMKPKGSSAVIPTIPARPKLAKDLS